MSYLKDLQSILKDNVNDLPLSLGQYDLWLEQQIYPKDIWNHFNFVAKITEELKIEIFQRAIQLLAERHESIRTIFPVSTGIPLRKLLPSASVILQVIDCPCLSEDEIKQQLQKNFENPFDLSREIPFRFFLYRKSDSEFYFQIVQHHIASNMSSYMRISEELAKLYVSERDQKHLVLPDIAFNYSNFVQKNYERLKTEECKIDSVFWINYLSGDLSNLVMPFEQSSKGFSSFKNGVYHCDLDNLLSGKLSNIAHLYGTTFFSLITSAFQVFLHRYTKQHEIIIGIPNDEKKAFETQENLSSLIGYTTNTLPLRTRLDSDKDFIKLLNEVGNDLRNMSQHCLYPTSMILNDIRYRKGDAFANLFNVLVISQKTYEFKELSSFGTGKQDVSIDFDGFKYQSIGMGHLPAGRFDLALGVVEKSTLSFHYNESKFNQQTIQRLASNFLRLLQSIVSNPNQKIGQFSIISDKELDLQLTVWNNTKQKNEFESFLENFEKKVLTDPNAIAIVFEGKTMTYNTLNSRANQLAHYLQKLGATKETLIGIGIKRSFDLFISLLGVMKAGSAYLPMDPDHPKERLMFMLQDSKAEILITQRSLKRFFHDYDGKKIFLDNDWDKISNEDCLNTSLPIDPNQLAYVIYTSGSTGKPKGVEIPQRALDNLLESMQKSLHLTSFDRCLAATTISFDISNLEILLPLCQGATIVLVSQETLKDVPSLIQVLEKEQITFAQMTPSLWQILIDLGWKGSPKLTILCGGEIMSPSLAEQLLTLCHSLWNMYGPTETTIWSSMKKIVDSQSKITIGRPVGNTTFYILDENREIQPIGVPGDLYIGGMGLARGYRNRSDLTEERFILSPFLSSLSERLYKTGDTARYTPNGEVEYLGRSDYQVKIRGHRIEIGEIEETIKKYPEINQVVVLVREDRPGDQRIVAYITGIFKEQEIKRHLTSKLPSYMVPSAFITLPELPLTPNGKIDRKALPVPKFQDESDSTPPRNDIEKQILKIFQEILNFEKVGIYSNFFSLGGHSLLAARVISKINKTFYINLPLRALLENPCIALIAEQVTTFLKGYRDSEIQKATPHQKFRLSYAQQRFWFLEQQNPNSAAYSIPFLLELSGKLDIGCLQKAIETIVQRHEILRTIFKEELEEPVQIVLQHLKPSIHYEDLSHISTAERKAKILISSLARRPFELTVGPLFYFALLRLEETRHLFFLNFHHIIFDGFSFKIFLEELKVLYEHYYFGKPNPLRDLDIQYVDYAAWEQKIPDSGKEEEDLSWWLEKLKDAPSILNLPTDTIRPAVQTFGGSLFEFSLVAQNDLENLKKLAQQHQATMFMVLLAAFHVFLYKYTNQNDFVIGVPVSEKNYSNLDSLIGSFVNTLPLRTTSNSKSTFLDLLKNIRDQSLEAFKHQEVSFEKIVDKLKIERSLSFSPLFQVMFNMLPEVEIDKIFDLQMRVSNVDREMSHFDLSLSVQKTSNGLIGIFEYNTDIFLKNSIKRMSKHFHKLVKEIIKNPNQSISELQVLTDSEIQRQIVEWNDQPILYPKEESIIESFEKWAARTPDAIAVICNEKKFSYQEINDQANEIAHTLLSLGIKPESKVVICLERTERFISSVLGVLKAGGAYIPVDSFEPKERMTSILNDLQPFCILTQEKMRSSFFSGFTILCIDGLINNQVNNPKIPISKKQLAYIIYTSGSTGKPKGVEIEYGSINDRVAWKNARYPLDSSDVMLHTYSFIFDGSIINYFWPLCAGAQLVIATKDEVLDSSALVQLIKTHNVTTMDLLPSLLQSLVEEKDIISCKSLKNVFSGGEALSTEIMQSFYKKCSAKLHNTYGPTEATVEASVWECPFDYEEGFIAPIGRPIAGAKLYVLDSDRNIVPVGVLGELYIGGIGLARGYFGDLLLTNEKFIFHLDEKNPLGRLYRTGDLVKYNHDGNIEFIGRIDNQVKLRGYRIDLREIEATLLKMDFVDNALVVIKGSELHKSLIAYVVTSHIIDKETFPELVKNFLKNHLPAYMIPQMVVIIDKIPTLLNGKVNYKALPEPKLTYDNVTLEARACKNDLERKLFSIWKEILSYQDLSINDNFFEVGGNSLLAMRLMAKIKSSLNISIPLVCLFKYPTIESFAEAISSLNTLKDSPIVLMQPGNDKNPFFCVHPVGGNILCYNALAKNWLDERPFYAIRAQGVEEDEIPHESIEKMAKEYIKSIQEVQPTGPYIIGGWSFGGLISAEMVNQLQKQGEKVSLLVLIDTSANIEKFKQINIEDESLLLSELTNHFLASPYLFKNNISLKEQFARFIDNGGRKPINESNNAVNRLVSLAKANYRALQTFSIPTLDVKTILIRTKENPEKTRNLGWNKYIADLKVILAPGDHWAITHENLVNRYSQILKSCFESLPETKTVKIFNQAIRRDQ